MAHIYNDTFFDYIDEGARKSAQAFIGHLNRWLVPSSVLDLGCGRGVWLREWKDAGAHDVLGVDGDYVDRSRLLIPEDRFQGKDLTHMLDLGRRFDLAQSLEVGEHLPEDSADVLVSNLTAASDIVLFSAATVGQGGEFHINEQPLSYWQEKFAAQGYRAYDVLRPLLKGNTDVEPWYRYNAVLYANANGHARLPKEVTATRLADGQVLRNAGGLKWRLRRGVVAVLPQTVVTRIAQVRASILASAARQKSAG